MNNSHRLLTRGLVPLALLALPVSLLGSAPSQGAPGVGAERASQGTSASATTSALSASATGTVFRETFGSGTKAWTKNSRTSFRTVRGGHRSKKAARLSARSSGRVVAKTVVRPGARAGSRHVVSAWGRSLSGPTRARLLVTEVNPSTGKVVKRRSEVLTLRSKWKRAKVALVTSRSKSVLTVRLVARQKRGDRALADSVKVTRTSVGGQKSPGTPSPTGFPNASNTGVPSGVQVSGYTGPMTIRKAGTVIDGKRITGSLSIQAKNVVIRNSVLNGTVYVERSGSMTMTDSTVDGGRSADSAVAYYNLTLKRVEVVGARASVACAENCHVEDSWLHGQYMKPGSDWHGDGFLTNGGDNMSLVHNTLACDSDPTGAGGACSAALAAYGDFAPVTNLTVDNNLFVKSPAGYCLYGGHDSVKPYGREARNVRITNNVFERGPNGKCGVFGAVANVAPAGNPNGNVFRGNVWADGKAVSR